MGAIRQVRHVFNTVPPHWARPAVLFGLTLMLGGLFLEVSEELYEDDEVERLDRRVLLWVAQLRVAALNGIMVDLTALGSPTVVVLFSVLGCILLTFFNRDVRGAIFLAVGSSGAGIATWLAKLFFGRERPSEVASLVQVSGFSYPSGHSLAASAFYLLLMVLAFRRYRALRARLFLGGCALLLIAGVCFSRVYLGVHYPSDVLGGALLGAAWICFLTVFFARPRAVRTS